MIGSVRSYRVVESMLGRSMSWRLGRWLYFGARRNVANDPRSNGEYALQRWALDAEAQIGDSWPLTFLDIGANNGDWSIAMVESLAGRSMADYRLIAFEPVPDLAGTVGRRLSGEIAEGRVFVEECGVGAKAGTANLSITGTGTGTNSLAAQHDDTIVEEIAVPLVTIDQRLDSYGGRALMVKVDTEGNDYNVISGAMEALKAGKIGVLQFEYNWRWISFRHYLRDVFDCLESIPYRLCLVTSDCLEMLATWHPELERFVECNYALVHEEMIDWLPVNELVFNASNIAEPAAKGKSH